jgi:hypothetical protein
MAHQQEVFEKMAHIFYRIFQPTLMFLVGLCTNVSDKKVRQKKPLVARC